MECLNTVFVLKSKEFLSFPILIADDKLLINYFKRYYIGKFVKRVVQGTS